MSCGDRHTAVLTDTGSVITFGSGEHGQLGHGNGLDQLRPCLITVQPLASEKIITLDCGATVTAAVNESGQLYLWGFGESLHRKGESNIVDAPRPVHLFKETVRQVACGQGHVCILTENGDVYSMGTNGFGQLGCGSKANVRNPRLILRGKEIQSIAVGRYHSMAVTAYGIVYSW